MREAANEELLLLKQRSKEFEIEKRIFHEEKRAQKEVKDIYLKSKRVLKSIILLRRLKNRRSRLNWIELNLLHMLRPRPVLWKRVQ
jgi:hypothetical protein